MSTRIQSFLTILVLASGALGQVATAADQDPGAAPVAGAAAPQAGAPSAGLKVILLKPSIRVEAVTSVVRPGMLDPNEYIPAPGLPAEYEEPLLSAAEQALAGKATLLGMSMLDPSVSEACKKLEPLASRLARGHVNEEATDGLAHLAALDERYAILVQFFRVETGPGNSWNPMNGQITSSSASTLIQAAVLSGKTAKVLWKGERLIRYKALPPNDFGLKKALADLYQNFEIQGGN